MKPTGSLTLLCVACLTIMVGCVIVPGLPAIAGGLGVPGAASWLVTLPSLGVVVFGPLAGPFIRRAGLHRALCLGLFLYGALGAMGAWLHGPVPVFADRLLLGGATAIVMAAGTGLISEFHDGPARLAMIARQGMAIELGGVVFLSIGGVLAALGWRWPFLLYLVAWIFLAMVLAFVPRPPVAGTVPAEAPAAAAAVRIADVYVAALASMVLFFTGVILLPQRLHLLGLDEAAVGYFLSFASLVAVGAACAMPRVTRALGSGLTLALGFAAYALAHALFWGLASMPSFLAGGAMMGCGFGLTIPLVNHLTVERSPPARRGHMLGYLSVAMFLGQFLSSFLEALPGGATPFLVALLGALVLCLAYAALARREAQA